MSEETMVRALEPQDISDEASRTYDFQKRTYVINSPKKLWAGKTTHRVQDESGEVHCVPAPGYFGCVLRWIPKDAVQNPV